MAGGLMQLVAYGAQDVYLTGNPKVTFFQAVYKRHTNFAMECIEQVVNGSASNSGRLSVTVARNGDLVGEMQLELTAKTGLGSNTIATNNTVWLAERAIADIELTIGGQRIDKHYQKWWRLYAELYLDDAKKAEWGKMTSCVASTGTETVYLPLIFFFNRNPGLYLPLIALQYHEVRLDIDLSSAYDTFFTGSPKVWANYVYLDTEERRRFAQKGHEYLIEQVQHTGTDTVTQGATTQIRLSYNHPVKELVWCYTEGATTAAGDNLWNFSNAVSEVVLSADAMAHSNCLVAPGACGAPMVVLDEGRSMWHEEGAGARGPLDTFKLILNGQDRFKEQKGKYFNQIQPFYHHSGNPYPGIYSYSFALKPEEHQPTGSCNFSRIDNAQVSTTLKASAVGAVDAQHMFAVNYNVLRIQSGMGGLAFSN